MANTTVDPSSSASEALPTIPGSEELIERLRRENAQLRAELAELRSARAPVPGNVGWESEMASGIVYSDDRSHTSAKSAGRLLTLDDESTWQLGNPRMQHPITKK